MTDGTEARQRAQLQRLLREQYCRQTGAVPLSPGQRALWELERRQPHSAVNLEAFALRFLAPPDRAMFEAILQQLLDRHPCLRSTIKVLAGEPVQLFHERLPAALQLVDAQAWSEAEWRERFRAAAHQTIDLEK